MTAPTLHQALALIPQIVKFQNTASRFWLAVSGNRVQFCATMPLSRDSPGHVIAEMSTLAAAERIVQAFAGDDFRPTRILLSARRRDLHFDLDNTYEGTPVHADQRYCAIEFPRHLLAAERRMKTQPPARSDQVGDQEPPPPSFAETVATCLVAYLPEGYPHIELAADISGLKVRTLQRQLRAEGSTYSEVVDRARCRAALAWLRDSDIGLAELSLELGYSEQSAFSRAFRRWTGTTAAQYREDSARLSVPG
jgi:AraC-like DNA-binding protein